MEPRVIRAILHGQPDLRLLLQESPGIVSTCMKRDQLIKSIPHWLYRGDTALHLAAAAVKLESTELLLDAGANANMANRRGATPLHYACDPRPATLGSVWNSESQIAIITLLLQHHADLEHTDDTGATPLHRAVRARSTTAVNRLLKAGARVDSRLKKQQSTPLHLAVHSTGAGGTAGVIEEQIKIIRLLLQYGADPATTDAKGKSAHEGVRNEQIRAAFQAL